MYTSSTFISGTCSSSDSAWIARWAASSSELGIDSPISSPPHVTRCREKIVSQRRWTLTVCVELLSKRSTLDVRATPSRGHALSHRRWTKATSVRGERRAFTALVRYWITRLSVIELPARVRIRVHLLVLARTDPLEVECGLRRVRTDRLKTFFKCRAKFRPSDAPLLGSNSRSLASHDIFSPRGENCSLEDIGN